MPWDEDEFRRALESASARAEPHPAALRRLRARGRRQQRMRAVRYSASGLAIAAAIVLVVVTLAPNPAVQRGSLDLGDAQVTGAVFGLPTVSGGASPRPGTARPGIAQANSGSALSSIAGDGKSAAYVSDASNLVPGDTNRASDVFLRDFVTRKTIRVSVGSGGTQANGASRQPDLSHDGRYIAFVSDATNLVAGDTNRHADVFRHDRKTGETVLVSVASNGTSLWPSISADGNLIAFASEATTLVSEDTNVALDIFVRDVTKGVTRRASVSSFGAQADGPSSQPALSADGRIVAFTSAARNFAVLPAPELTEIYAHDLSNGTTERVSVTASGDPANAQSLLPSISADGSRISFLSAATNLDPAHPVSCVLGVKRTCTNAYVRDRLKNTTNELSLDPQGAQPNDDTFSTAISGNGRYVAFSSEASNLVPGHENNHREIFLRDLADGSTTIVSLSITGFANNNSGGPSISEDGDAIVFQSLASNLVSGDTNSLRDVFVRRIPLALTGRISIPAIEAKQL